MSNETKAPENVQAQPDMVNNPPHYNMGKIETIDVIEDTLTMPKVVIDKLGSRAPYVGMLCGTIIKYLRRWPYKGGVQDLEKARWYLDKVISILKGENWEN